MNIEEMCNKIQIVPLQGNEHPLPTEKQISEFESQADFSLPDDYKYFIKLFGIGELASFFRIYSPINSSTGNRNYDLLSFNQLSRSRPNRLKSYNNPAITDELVLFCSTIGGDWYGWNKLEKRIGQTTEYTIYELNRYKTETTCVSSSFSDFLEKCCSKLLLEADDKNERWFYLRY